MQISKATLQDLAFFKGEQNIFSLINKCITQAGSDLLRKHIQYPPKSFHHLLEYQQSVSFLMKHSHEWEHAITNGTVVMIRQYFESAEGASTKPNLAIIWFDKIFRKVFKKEQYSYIKFSIAHVSDLLKGCNELINLLQNQPPKLIANELLFMQQALGLPLCKELLHSNKLTSTNQMLQLNYRTRRELKHTILAMIDSYSRLDMLAAMAKASLELNWNLPELLSSEKLCFKASNLYHPLLNQPIPYNIVLSKSQNFMLLTGANMSGKSTFIRSIGIGAILAHIGMAVPASDMQISFLENMVSNMHIEDDILKGESYFYAEVLRMKTTAEQLNKNNYNLVLMDELFKGTNVHDAYDCTKAVIDGLLHRENNLMILSTHLYELAEAINSYPINFKYFYTDISKDNKYTFTYILKDGVSNDRIGYWIMKEEGIMDILYHSDSNNLE